ncbi:MAG: cytochrome c [Deltaproteobacteria bacterium]|nr:cytochrome c [Deltaproteobacteria bacterium]
MTVRTTLATLAIVVAALGALAACGAPSSERVTRVLGLTGTASSGAAVYTRACASCHDADGTGTSQPMSALVPAEDDVGLAQVVAGGSHVPTSAMSEQEAADLMAYLRQTWPG